MDGYDGAVTQIASSWLYGHSLGSTSKYFKDSQWRLFTIFVQLLWKTFTSFWLQSIFAPLDCFFKMIQIPVYEISI
jgi:hypothetical protein